jgi:radical SAM protein with 4Fe4S-binding SPASM domain
MTIMRFRLLLARVQARGLQYTIRLVLFRAVEFLRTNTLRKLANLVLTKIQRWLRCDRVLGMPYQYNIDPANVCNLHCPLCPTGLGTLARRRGKMALMDFKRIVDQIAPYAYYLELYNWGEPFLHPEIFDMIQYATKHRISVRLSSNLNHFSQEMACQTVRSGLATLIVAVDGATQESYERYRRGGHLATVLENIRLLVDAKRRTCTSRPFIVLRMLASRHNEGEIEDLRYTAHELGVNAFTTGTLFINTRDEAQAQEWLPTDGRLSYYDYQADCLENMWDCADLWERCVINHDGGVAPCCWLQDPAHDFGNALEKSLQKIWNGEAYVSSRRVFSRGGSRTRTAETICARCRGRPEYLTY